MRDEIPRESNAADYIDAITQRQTEPLHPVQPPAFPARTPDCGQLATAQGYARFQRWVAPLAVFAAETGIFPVSRKTGQNRCFRPSEAITGGMRGARFPQYKKRPLRQTQSVTVQGADQNRSLLKQDARTTVQAHADSHNPCYVN